MKRVYWLIPMLAIIMALGLGWFTGKVATRNAEPVQAQVGPPATIDVQALKSQMGLSFVPVDLSQVQPPLITRDEAIARAQQAKPKTKQATAITAELGFLGSPLDGVTIYNVRENHLVWLVSFQGVVSHASGEPGADGQLIGPSRVSNTYTVVIDATTGDVLVGLTCCD